MKLIDILVRDLHKFGGWPAGAVECVRYVGEATIDFYDETGNWNDDCSITYGAIAVELVRNETIQCDREEVSFKEYEAALAAKNDGWIEWSGGECPVDGDTIVDVRYSLASKFIGSKASDFDWVNRYRPFITHYRLHKSVEAKPEWNGEGLPPVGCIVEFYNSDRFDCRTSVPDDGARVKIVAHDETPDGIPVAIFTWNSRDGGVGAEVCRAELFRPLRTEADRKRDAACRVISDILDENRDFQFDAKKIYDAISSGKIPGVKLED